MNNGYLLSIKNAAQSQMSILKRAAKKLHLASPKFIEGGMDKETCEELLACAFGFRNWQEVKNLGYRPGPDQCEKPWFIHHRTESHESILLPLLETELQLDAKRPLFLVGELALKVALVLFLEEISARSKPGAIFIKSELPLRKTEFSALLKHAEIGQRENVDQFLVVDTRIENQTAGKVADQYRHRPIIFIWNEASRHVLQELAAVCTVMPQLHIGEASAKEMTISVAEDGLERVPGAIVAKASTTGIEANGRFANYHRRLDTGPPMEEFDMN